MGAVQSLYGPLPQGWEHRLDRRFGTSVFVHHDWKRVSFVHPAGLQDGHRKYTYLADVNPAQFEGAQAVDSAHVLSTSYAAMDTTHPMVRASQIMTTRLARVLDDLSLHNAKKHLHASTVAYRDWHARQLASSRTDAEMQAGNYEHSRVLGRIGDNRFGVDILTSSVVSTTDEWKEGLLQGVSMKGFEQHLNLIIPMFESVPQSALPPLEAVGSLCRIRINLAIGSTDIRDVLRALLCMIIVRDRYDASAAIPVAGRLKILGDSIKSALQSIIDSSQHPGAAAWLQATLTDADMQRPKASSSFFRKSTIPVDAAVRYLAALLGALASAHVRYSSHDIATAPFCCYLDQSTFQLLDRVLHSVTPAAYPAYSDSQLQENCAQLCAMLDSKLLSKFRRIISNVVKRPSEPKFRRIKVDKTNATIQALLQPLQMVGFKFTDSFGDVPHLELSISPPDSHVANVLARMRFVHHYLLTHERMIQQSEQKGDFVASNIPVLQGLLSVVQLHLRSAATLGFPVQFLNGDIGIDQLLDEKVDCDVLCDLPPSYLNPVRRIFDNLVMCTDACQGGTLASADVSRHQLQRITAKSASILSASLPVLLPDPRSQVLFVTSYMNRNVANDAIQASIVCAISSHPTLLDLATPRSGSIVQRSLWQRIVRSTDSTVRASAADASVVIRLSDMLVNPSTFNRWKDAPILRQVLQHLESSQDDSLVLNTGVDAPASSASASLSAAGTSDSKKQPNRLSTPQKSPVNAGVPSPLGTPARSSSVPTFRPLTPGVLPGMNNAFSAGQSPDAMANAKQMTSDEESRDSVASEQIRVLGLNFDDVARAGDLHTDFGAQSLDEYAQHVSANITVLLESLVAQCTIHAQQLQQQHSNPNFYQHLPAPALHALAAIQRNIFARLFSVQASSSLDRQVVVAAVTVYATLFAEFAISHINDAQVKPAIVSLLSVYLPAISACSALPYVKFSRRMLESLLPLTLHLCQVSSGDSTSDSIRPAEGPQYARFFKAHCDIVARSLPNKCIYSDVGDSAFCGNHLHDVLVLQVQAMLRAALTQRYDNERAKSDTQMVEQDEFSVSSSAFTFVPTRDELVAALTAYPEHVLASSAILTNSQILDALVAVQSDPSVLDSITFDNVSLRSASSSSSLQSLLALAFADDPLLPSSSEHVSPHTSRDRFLYAHMCAVDEDESVSNAHAGCTVPTSVNVSSCMCCGNCFSSLSASLAHSIKTSLHLHGGDDDDDDDDDDDSDVKSSSVCDSPLAYRHLLGDTAIWALLCVNQNLTAVDPSCLNGVVSMALRHVDVGAQRPASSAPQPHADSTNKAAKTTAQLPSTRWLQSSVLKNGLSKLYTSELLPSDGISGAVRKSNDNKQTEPRSGSDSDATFDLEYVRTNYLRFNPGLISELVQDVADSNAAKLHRHVLEHPALMATRLLRGRQGANVDRAIRAATAVLLKHSGMLREARVLATEIAALKTDADQHNFPELSERMVKVWRTAESLRMDCSRARQASGVNMCDEPDCDRAVTVQQDEKQQNEMYVCAAGHSSESCSLEYTLDFDTIGDRMLTRAAFLLCVEPAHDDDDDHNNNDDGDDDHDHDHDDGDDDDGAWPAQPKNEELDLHRSSSSHVRGLLEKHAVELSPTVALNPKADATTSAAHMENAPPLSFAGRLKKNQSSSSLLAAAFRGRASSTSLGGKGSIGGALSARDDIFGEISRFLSSTTMHDVSNIQQAMHEAIDGAIGRSIAMQYFVTFIKSFPRDWTHIVLVRIVNAVHQWNRFATRKYQTSPTDTSDPNDSTSGSNLANRMSPTYTVMTRHYLCGLQLAGTELCDSVRDSFAVLAGQVVSLFGRCLHDDDLGSSTSASAISTGCGVDMRALTAALDVFRQTFDSSDFAVLRGLGIIELLDSVMQRFESADSISRCHLGRSGVLDRDEKSLDLDSNHRRQRNPCWAPLLAVSTRQVFRLVAYATLRHSAAAEADISLDRNDKQSPAVPMLSRLMGVMIRRLNGLDVQNQPENEPDCYETYSILLLAYASAAMRHAFLRNKQLWRVLFRHALHNGTFNQLSTRVRRRALTLLSMMLPQVRNIQHIDTLLQATLQVDDAACVLSTMQPETEIGDGKSNVSVDSENADTLNGDEISDHDEVGQQQPSSCVSVVGSMLRCLGYYACGRFLLPSGEFHVRARVCRELSAAYLRVLQRMVELPGWRQQLEAHCVSALKNSRQVMSFLEDPTSSRFAANASEFREHTFQLWACTSVLGGAALLIDIGSRVKVLQPDGSLAFATVVTHSPHQVKIVFEADPSVQTFSFRPTAVEVVTHLSVSLSALLRNIDESALASFASVFEYSVQSAEPENYDPSSEPSEQTLIMLAMEASKTVQQNDCSVLAAALRAQSIRVVHGVLSELVTHLTESSSDMQAGSIEHPLLRILSSEIYVRLLMQNAASVVPLRGSYPPGSLSAHMADLWQSYQDQRMMRNRMYPDSEKDVNPSAMLERQLHIDLGYKAHQLFGGISGNEDSDDKDTISPAQAWVRIHTNAMQQWYDSSRAPSTSQSEGMASLLKLGFSQKLCEFAYLLHNGDADEAASWLLQNGAEFSSESLTVPLMWGKDQAIDMFQEPPCEDFSAAPDSNDTSQMSFTARAHADTYRRALFEEPAQMIHCQLSGQPSGSHNAVGGGGGGTTTTSTLAAMATSSLTTAAGDSTANTLSLNDQALLSIFGELPSGAGSGSSVPASASTASQHAKSRSGITASVVADASHADSSSAHDAGTGEATLGRPHNILPLHAEDVRIGLQLRVSPDWVWSPSQYVSEDELDRKDDEPALLTLSPSSKDSQSVQVAWKWYQMTDDNNWAPCTPDDTLLMERALELNRSFVWVGLTEPVPSIVRLDVMCVFNQLTGHGRPLRRRRITGSAAQHQQSMLQHAYRSLPRSVRKVWERSFGGISKNSGSSNGNSTSSNDDSKADSSATAVAAHSKPPSLFRSESSLDVGTRQLVSQMESMGFKRKWCIEALGRNNTNTERALDWLLSNMDMLESMEQREAEVVAKYEAAKALAEDEQRQLDKFREASRTAALERIQSAPPSHGDGSGGMLMQVGDCPILDVSISPRIVRCVSTAAIVDQHTSQQAWWQFSAHVAVMKSLSGRVGTVVKASSDLTRVLIRFDDLVEYPPIDVWMPVNVLEWPDRWVSVQYPEMAIRKVKGLQGLLADICHTEYVVWSRHVLLTLLALVPFEAHGVADQRRMLELAVERKVCTFTATDRNYARQQWFNCRTCIPSNAGVGVCPSCKDTCHAGHEVLEAKTSNGPFFCDCGAGDMPKPCSCIGDKAALVAAATPHESKDQFRIDTSKVMDVLRFVAASGDTNLVDPFSANGMDTVGSNDTLWFVLQTLLTRDLRAPDSRITNAQAAEWRSAFHAASTDRHIRLLPDSDPMPDLDIDPGSLAERLMVPLLTSLRSHLQVASYRVRAFKSSHPYKADVKDFRHVHIDNAKYLMVQLDRRSNLNVEHAYLAFYADKEREIEIASWTGSRPVTFVIPGDSFYLEHRSGISQHRREPSEFGYDMRVIPLGWQFHEGGEASFLKVQLGWPLMSLILENPKVLDRLLCQPMAYEFCHDMFRYMITARAPHKVYVTRCAAQIFARLAVILRAAEVRPPETDAGLARLQAVREMASRFKRKFFCEIWVSVTEQMYHNGVEEWGRGMPVLINALFDLIRLARLTVPDMKPTKEPLWNENYKLYADEMNVYEPVKTWWMLDLLRFEQLAHALESGTAIPDARLVFKRAWDLLDNTSVFRASLQKIEYHLKWRMQDVSWMQARRSWIQRVRTMTSSQIGPLLLEVKNSIPAHGYSNPFWTTSTEGRNWNHRLSDDSVKTVAQYARHLLDFEAKLRFVGFDEKQQVLDASWTSARDDWIAALRGIIERETVPLPTPTAALAIKWTREMDHQVVKYVESYMAKANRSLMLLSFRDLNPTPAELHERFPLLEDVPLGHLRLRFGVIRLVNTIIERVIRSFDLSYNQLWSISPLIRRTIKHLGFSATRANVWNQMLSRSLSRAQDPQFVILNRQAAARPRAEAKIKMRHSLFMQLYRILRSVDSQALRRPVQSWRVKFVGEAGHDVGGMYNESVNDICSELQSEEHILPILVHCPNFHASVGQNQEKWLPNPDARSASDLRLFYFFGRLLGIACLDTNRVMSLDLPSIVWKTVVGEKPSIHDLEDIDYLTTKLIVDVFTKYHPADGGAEPVSDEKHGGTRVGSLHLDLGDPDADSKSIQHLFDTIQLVALGPTCASSGSSAAVDTAKRVSGANFDLSKYDSDDDEEESSGVHFVVSSATGRSVELIPGGSSILVTRHNYLQFVRLALNFRLGEFDLQMTQIMRGMTSLVPLHYASMFSWHQLEEVITGTPIIDMQILRNNTIYRGGYSANDRPVRMLWSVLESFPMDDRRMFLQFVWGRNRLPATSSGFYGSHFKIMPHQGSVHSVHADKFLPVAHTCFFLLELPRYSSEYVLRRKLLYAIRNCLTNSLDNTLEGRANSAMRTGADPFADDD
jgi:HECT-domain (ubiquitin-transferase)/Putative zinc finger in N-recognin (UBR box)/UBA-like domain